MVNGSSRCLLNRNAVGPALFAPMSGSDDLLTLFDLAPAYDRYVRPYLKPPEPASATTADATVKVEGGAKPATAVVDLKGKGKATEGDGQKPGVNGSAAGSEGKPVETNPAAPVDTATPTGATGAGPGAGAGKEAPKRAKMEKSYGHWVADVGGRNSIKKDHYLRDLMMNPEWQPPPAGSIRPLDVGILREGFTLLPGALPGVSRGGTLVLGVSGLIRVAPVRHLALGRRGRRSKAQGKFPSRSRRHRAGPGAYTADVPQKKKRKHGEPGVPAGDTPTSSAQSAQAAGRLNVGLTEDEHRKRKRARADELGSASATPR